MGPPNSWADGKLADGDFAAIGDKQLRDGARAEQLRVQWRAVGSAVERGTTGEHAGSVAYRKCAGL